MTPLPVITDENERLTLCMFCRLRDRQSPDRSTCKASGGNAWQHARDAACPKDFFPRIIPPKAGEVEAIAAGPYQALPRGWELLPEVKAVYRAALASAVKGFTQPPAGGAGRGLIIVAGGRYALVGLLTLKLIRETGCNLPCEIWRLPSEPLDDWQVKAAENLNVTFRQPATPMRYEHGWSLKARALLETSFDEVIFRDSDSYDLIDPASLFDASAYKETGAIFWPDPPKYNLVPEVWNALGLPFRWEPTFETGQLIVDRRRCWRELRLTDWICSHAEYYWKLGPRDPRDSDGFYGQGVYGDKDCFHLAWRYLDSDYGLAPRTYDHADPAVIHFDLDGKTPRIIHRIHGKAVLKVSDATFLSWQRNERNDKLPREELYWRYLEELKETAPKPPPEPVPPPTKRGVFDGSKIWLEWHKRPNTADLSKEADYLTNQFPKLLGCSSCRDSWIKLTTDHPPVLTSRYGYARWQWARHNDVSRPIGNTEMTWEDACKLHSWPTEETA